MCVRRVANTGLPVLTFSLAARGMLNGMHGRRVVAAMVLLHAAEVAALLTAVTVTGGLARSHPGRGMGLAMLLLLVATLLVGWQGYRLLAGRRSLNVAGLAVQSGIVMVAIAFATQNLAVGGFGIVLACSVLAGWGRLAKTSSGQRCRVEGRAGRLGGGGGQRVARVRARTAASQYCGESNLGADRGGIRHHHGRRICRAPCRA
jgi:hypothetical protein